MYIKTTQVKDTPIRVHHVVIDRQLKVNHSPFIWGRELFQGEQILEWKPLGIYADSDESGHLFQSISDTIPGLSDSCRSEATL
jgi:hypothetical protein